MLKQNAIVEWIGDPVLCTGVNVKSGDLLSVVNEVPGKNTGYIMLKQIDGPYKGISFFAQQDEFIEIGPTNIEDLDFL